MVLLPAALLLATVSHLTLAHVLFLAFPAGGSGLRAGDRRGIALSGAARTRLAAGLGPARPAGRRRLAGVYRSSCCAPCRQARCARSRWWPPACSSSAWPAACWHNRARGSPGYAGCSSPGSASPPSGWRPAGLLPVLAAASTPNGVPCRRRCGWPSPRWSAVPPLAAFHGLAALWPTLHQAGHPARAHHLHPGGRHSPAPGLLPRWSACSCRGPAPRRRLGHPRPLPPHPPPVACGLLAQQLTPGFELVKQSLLQALKETAL